MFVLLQRYTFWSNSQHISPRLSKTHCCLYYCKDTLFEAIHNHNVVYSVYLVLFVLLQRYTFWSNSQPLDNQYKIIGVVCITAKIHFLKQFTTNFSHIYFTFSCLYYCKDTLFEAIHNNGFKLVVNSQVVCITAKIHFLKQFTTRDLTTSICLRLFVLLQRYTFWSNSQHPLSSFLPLYVVCITAKIHFLKQFTTDKRNKILEEGLFVLLQRYTFWSNSQPLIACLYLLGSCLYYCKDTLFEAIHNMVDMWRN